MKTVQRPRLSIMYATGLVISLFTIQAGSAAPSDPAKSGSRDSTPISQSLAGATRGGGTESTADTMVWKVTWLNAEASDFQLQAARLSLDGWEPFSIATYPVGSANLTYYTQIGYRKKFPRAEVERELAVLLAQAKEKADQKRAENDKRRATTAEKRQEELKGLANAVERIPDGSSRFAAGFIAMRLSQKLPELPGKIELEPDRAFGQALGSLGTVLVIPDRKLTSGLITQSDQAELPIGVLFLRQISVKRQGALVEVERLTMVTISDDESVTALFLTMSGRGPNPTLNVYSSGPTPILTIPLKKVSGDSQSPLGIQISNIDVKSETFDTKITLGGAYEGALNFSLK